MVDQNKYYKDGIIGGWTEEFFREHAPNLSRYIDETDPSAWQIAKFDGELMYSIPCFRKYDTIVTPVVWRTDWLENVGITEIPRTLEEFEEAFYKFTKEDPDGNGKMIPMGCLKQVSVLFMVRSAVIAGNGFWAMMEKWFTEM